MMRVWLRAAAGLALAIGLAGASPQPEGVPTAMRLMADIGKSLERNDLAGSLRKIDAALVQLPEPGAERGAFLQLRGAVLNDLERYSEALVALEQAIAMLPEDDADVRLTIATLQLSEGKAVEASRTIIHVSDRFPDQVGNLNTAWVARLMRALDPKTEADARFELALALVSRGFADLEEPGAMDWVRSEAILGLIRRNRVDEARPLVAGFTNASSVIEMLIDKQYAPLWPDIEAAAGPRAGRAIAADMEAAEDAYRRDPKNLDALFNYLTTLRMNGRSAEAITAAAPYSIDIAATAKQGETAVWLVSAQAKALAAAGRIDDADAVYERLLTLDMRQHPYLVGMAINRGIMLLEAGRPTDALKAAAWAELHGKAAVNDLGRMFIWQTQSCANALLGDAGAAAAAMAKLEEKRTANASAYMLGLLCNDRLDDAEKTVVERLRDPDRRGDMIYSLQDFSPPSTAGYWRAMRAKLLTVRDRPAVRAAIDQSGRVLGIAAPESSWASF